MALNVPSPRLPQRVPRRSLVTTVPSPCRFLRRSTTATAVAPPPPAPSYSSVEPALRHCSGLFGDLWILLPPPPPPSLSAALFRVRSPLLSPREAETEGRRKRRRTPVSVLISFNGIVNTRRDEGETSSRGFYHGEALKQGETRSLSLSLDERTANAVGALRVLS